MSKFPQWLTSNFLCSALYMMEYSSLAQRVISFVAFKLARGLGFSAEVQAADSSACLNITVSKIKFIYTTSDVATSS